MNSILSGESMQGLADAIRNLLDAQAQLGNELLAVMTGNEQQNSCDIPEPCWMPQSAGEVVSQVCPGSVATLKIEITNCDATGRLYQVSAAGSAAGSVSIQPTSLALGAKERGTVTATLKAPDATAGQKLEALIWVRGCREHYLRWTVSVGDQGGACCHVVEIDDCPDYIHHWYDHFYCPRSCRERGTPADPHG
ncbi:MAG: hypothetical protein OES32_01250 [Acidobacteriota bacterium]|nr:hypothetical protein [Acidobacteriota bacterium]